MTPEEKLLALIQQDKRQAGTVTPQEKLLALIEQDKQKPEPSVPAQPVKEAVAPAPVAKPAPGPKPIPALIQPVAVVVPPPVKPAPGPAATVTPPAPVKAAPVEASTPVAVKKTPLVVLPPPPPPANAAAVAPATPSPAVVQQSVPVPSPVPTADKPGDSPKAPSPQPLIFPTIRVSGVTIVNRVLAVVVVLLIVVVFYSVAGTQRGNDAELRRLMSGAGERLISPLAISDEALPSLELFQEKVGRRNFFTPIVVEKDNTGAAVPVMVSALKDLKLVAVSVDAAVPSESMGIIKNKTDSKTYFVKIGESVGDTGFILDKVLADRLVLKKGKQECELK